MSERNEQASDARLWPCRSCGMSLRDCTEEPDPLGVCCAVCGQAARGNHGEYEWQPDEQRAARLTPEDGA